MDSIPQKQCSLCGQKYPATPEYFSKNRTRKGGLRYECKQCSRKENKRYYNEHLEKERERGRTKQHHRQIVCPEKIKEINTRSRKKHHEKRLADTRRWSKTPRGKAVRQALEYKRRALKCRSEGSFTAADIELHFRTQKGLCWWCGCKLEVGKYHIDHRVPLSRGGSNSANNICITCPHCNMTKHDKLPSEWSGRLL